MADTIQSIVDEADERMLGHVRHFESSTELQRQAGMANTVRGQAEQARMAVRHERRSAREEIDQLGLRGLAHRVDIARGYKEVEQRVRARVNEIGAVLNA